MILKKTLFGKSPAVHFTSLLLGGFLLSGCTGNNAENLVESSNASPKQGVFERPFKLLADGAEIQIVSPGFAFPVMHDISGDGRDDLIVGQFRQGKMGTYIQQGDGSFSWYGWLQAGGEDAIVPGVY